jgi:hypothetical protein
MGSFFGGRRRALGACGTLGLAGALVGGAAIAQGGTAGAQQAITVTAVPGGVTLGGPNAGALQEGFVRVALAAPRGGLAGVARLGPGVTPEQILAYDRARGGVPPTRLAKLVTSAFLNPGERQVASLRLADGNYVALAEGQNDRLFVQPFSVAASAAPGGAPAASARILMYDHGFRAPARIPGSGTLRVSNIGNSNHFIVGFRLNRARDARRVSGILRGELPQPQGPPPAQPASVLGILGPGGTNYVETKLRPGRYVIACFYSDRASAGREHAEFGMVRTLTVR